MVIRNVVIPITLLLLSVPALALAAESDIAVIEGKIINGTEGGGSVADQEITLKTYLDDSEVSVNIVNTDAGGKFTFEGLSTGIDYSYEVSLTFQRAEYLGERLAFIEGETIKSIEILVYDSTISDDGIRIEAAHTVIHSNDGILNVEEFSILVNETDRTYIGETELNMQGDRETLRFSLPPEATDLELSFGLMKCCVVSDGEGFYDTMAVLPGKKEILYSYHVYYESGEYIFSRRMDYPTEDYAFLVEGENIVITSDSLVLNEMLSTEGARYNYLTGEGFFPGEIIQVRLSNLPEARGRGLIIWAVLTLIVLGSGFSFVYLRKNRIPQPVSPENTQEQIKQELLTRLAQLDDDFEDGKIAEEDYRKLRTEVKMHLIDFMQREKSGRSGK